MEFLDFLQQEENNLKILEISQFTLNWFERNLDYIQSWWESPAEDKLIQADEIVGATKGYARNVLEIMRPELPDYAIFQKITEWENKQVIFEKDRWA